MSEGRRGPAAGRIQSRAKGQESKLVRKDQAQCAAERRRDRIRAKLMERYRGVAHLAGNTFASTIRPHILCSFTRCPLSQCLSCQAGCLSAALCTHTIFSHFLPPSLLPLSSKTHLLCARTHTHTLGLSHCLCVSLKRMSNTAQGEEVLIRGQQCDASRGP